MAGLSSRLTPWVTRLLMVNAAVYLVLLTIFTAPAFREVLQFDPAAWVHHPWTLITYLFLHADLVHLSLNSLVLFVFGPPVERRLGAGAFVVYYLFCGVGAALFATGLTGLIEVPPFVGASGALFGVMLAFAIKAPDARASVFPLTFPISPRTLLTFLVAVDIVAAVWAKDNIAHVAHIGGLLAGYLFFRIQDLTHRKGPARPSAVARRPVVTPMRVQDAVAELRPAIPRIDSRVENAEAEVDRVLDKIAQYGLDSLTSQEKKFLADVSERKRREQR